jgi:hypothetical protein
MRLHISDYQVTYGAQGDVRFREAPQQRFNEDFETRFITLEIATGERAALMDLLRNERAVTIDTEAPNLVFRR